MNKKPVTGLLKILLLTPQLTSKLTIPPRGPAEGRSWSLGHTAQIHEYVTLWLVCLLVSLKRVVLIALRILNYCCMWTPQKLLARQSIIYLAANFDIWMKYTSIYIIRSENSLLLRRCCSWWHYWQSIILLGKLLFILNTYVCVQIYSTCMLRVSVQ